MNTLDRIFNIHRARSRLFTEYSPGEVAYVGNSVEDNGVVGYVTPFPRDLVFRASAIVISAFCDATVQPAPFVACGRAGNGLAVLEPRTRMSIGALARVAAYINTAVRWRFNWYRQVTADRLKRIQLPQGPSVTSTYPVTNFLPETVQLSRSDWEFRSRKFALDELFDLAPGNYHSLSALPAGNVPVVSCGDEDNGIAGYFDVRKHLHANCLTIALNGSTLASKYHAYRFGAKDDVAVCLTSRPLRVTTVLFIQAMLEMERWRYSYYRKCYMGKLRRLTVRLPAKRGQIDEDVMESVIVSSPYWDFRSRRIAATAERSLTR